MMPIPIAQFLSRTAGMPPSGDMAQIEADRALAAEADAAEQQAAFENERDAAYARGVGDGEAKATADFERMLAEARVSAEVHLARERAAWAASCGARLAQDLHEACAALEHRIADQAGRVLEPFLEARILARALQELREALSVLLAGTDPSAIRIRGPADLLEAMRQGAAGAPDGAAGVLDGIEFVENEAVDIQILAADTTIETQLHAWAARLREAVI